MTPVESSKAPFDAVRRILQEHLPSFDPEVCEAVLGTRVANFLDGPPTWLEMIAPSSYGKTMIIEPLSGVAGGHIVSTLTTRTLLSGAYGPNGTDPSLLTHLGKRPFMIFKDLGTLLSDFRTRSEIFAQLREVYDGEFAKSYGNGLRRSWKGKATVIVVVTQAVDLFPSLDAQLGERFLKLRFRSLENPVELALKTLETTGREEEIKKLLHKAYVSAVRAAKAGLTQVLLSKDTKTRIAHLACLLAEVRTPVTRNKYRLDRIELPPETEGPFRTLKMLVLFARAQAALRGVTDLDEFSLLFRLTLDAMPEPRRSLLIEVAKAHLLGNPPSATEVKTPIADQYAKQVLDDLAAAGVVTSRERATTDGPGRPPREYLLTDRTLERLKHSGMIEMEVLNDDYIKV